MVEIGEHELTLKDLEELIFSNKKVVINQAVWDRVDASYEFLTHFAEDKIIYGINTGFGPMAQYVIDLENQQRLQYNLIRSHATGQGEMISAPEVKASMIARLNTLALGYSGIDRSVIEVLQKLINSDITPVIYVHGGVGASGDLVQLAHMAMVMIGEGEVLYKNERHPTSEVFNELKIEPIKIRLREGLAIMNGTSVMTGIGIVNLIRAKRAIAWSIAASAMICEMVRSFDDYFSEPLNAAKKHHEQQAVAKLMREILSTSKEIRQRESNLYESEIKRGTIDYKVQEYYSLRCVPQITGPVLHAINQAEALLLDEIHSANDNPIVDVKEKSVYHGGNFHGDYVAFEMDKVKIAMTKLSMLSERQINFLMNPNLNDIFPPFLNLGKLGYNFGMQGAQFTATSTTAENQMLANPMYVHSIPNNNDNQDIVSMGTNAAILAAKVIENTFEILSIQMIAIVQGVSYLKNQDRLSVKSQEVFNHIRNIIPPFDQDYPLYKNIGLVKEFLRENQILNL